MNEDLTRWIKFFCYIQHQIMLLGSNSESTIQLTHNQKHWLSDQLQAEIEGKICELEELKSTIRKKSQTDF
jgi:hypothetical protein